MIDEGESPNLPKDRLWQPVTVRWFAVVFGVSLAYAVLRYHVASNVPWSHFPLFILNKATSLAAVIFVACSYLVRKVIRWHKDDPHLQLVVLKFCGLMGFSLAAIHALFSLCLLTPAYFAKFFGDDGRLNLPGEAGLAVGVVALWALTMPGIRTLPMMPKALGGFRWKRSQRMGYWSLGLVSAHSILRNHRLVLATGMALEPASDQPVGRCGRGISPDRQALDRTGESASPMYRWSARATGIDGGYPVLFDPADQRRQPTCHYLSASGCSESSQDPMVHRRRYGTRMVGQAFRFPAARLPHHSSLLLARLAP